MLHFHIFCVNIFIFFKIKNVLKFNLLFSFYMLKYICKSVEETET